MTSIEYIRFLTFALTTVVELTTAKRIFEQIIKVSGSGILPP